MNTPAPWEAALQAHHEVLTFLHSGNAASYIQNWEADRYERYGLNAAQPSAAAGRFLLPDTFKADPIFITPDMLQVVYSAMESFDSKEPVGEDDFFIKNGFAYLPEPFYTIDRNGGRLAWRAISWNVTTMWTLDMRDDQLAQQIHKTGRVDFTEEEIKAAGIKPEQELVARITMWSHLDDPDDFPMPPDVMVVLKSFNTNWLISHMTSIPIAAIPDIREARGEGDEKATWLLFLRVLNRVMAEKIVLKTRQRPPRPFRRHAERKKWPVSDVIVIELRRRTTKGVGENESGREYSHRWMVRGHWRRVPYGPGKKYRRQRYIFDHPAGPEDKPLIVKRRVWNLDR